MTTVLFAGALVGLGLWWAWRGWSPSTEPLATALARFGQPRQQLEHDRGRRDLDALMARQVRRLGFVERLLERQRADLRIVGRTPDEQATLIGAYALLGLFAGALVPVGRAFGLPLPLFLSGWVALLGAVLGGLQPVVDLRDRARKRRSAFAHALSAYCVFVDMAMASGFGVEQSLETAASSGDGWQFAEIRGTLAAGRLRDEAPWEALARFGQEAEITDLVELAGAVSLAGEEGAAVRETVAGKARTIRERITADSEQAAAKVTVRMAVPAAFMLLGFMVLLGYPAGRAVLGGLG